ETIGEMSAVIDSMEELKEELLDKMIEIDESLLETKEEKPASQIQFEHQLIEAHEKIKYASSPDITNIYQSIQSQKKHFDSIEFELELKKLFEETIGTLWIISPWIKNATFKRIPFFSSYLKKGGRIFVAYSEPENEGDIMAYEEPLKQLLLLEK